MNARYAVSAVLAAALFAGMVSQAAAQADNSNSVIAPADVNGNAPGYWRTYPGNQTRDEYYRNGYDRSGYDRNGYDRNGYDRNGYDRNGYYRGSAVQNRQDYYTDANGRRVYRYPSTGNAVQSDSFPSTSGANNIKQ